MLRSGPVCEQYRESKQLIDTLHSHLSVIRNHPFFTDIKFFLILKNNMTYIFFVPCPWEPLCSPDIQLFLQVFALVN